MLQLKSNCECCDCDLPPDSVEAMMCSYECTFCHSCVNDVLQNVCPNCGGGFQQRPVRPATARREGVSLAHQPASAERVHARHDRAAMQTFAAQYADVPPELR